MKSTHLRPSAGSAIVELPALIWILLIAIVFPMINLSSCCLRSYFVYAAAHNAALSASKALSYQATVLPNLSAVDSASNTVTNIASLWTGVTVNSVVTRMVITDVNTNAETIRTAPLILPPDTVNNIYHIRVAVTAEVDPLLPFNLGLFGSVPGLTGPVTLTVSDQNFVENTQGLTN